MNRAVRRTVCGLAATLFTGSLLAQELMIYPKENQSQEQQEQDKFQCYSWARGETGFDPMAPPTATEPPPRKAAKQGGVARGAAGGAIVGGIFGGSDGAKKRCSCRWSNGWHAPARSAATREAGAAAVGAGSSPSVSGGSKPL